MKKIILLLLLLQIGLSYSQSLSDDNFTMTYEDEFNYNSISEINDNNAPVLWWNKNDSRKYYYRHPLDTSVCSSKYGAYRSTIGWTQPPWNWGPPNYVYEPDPQTIFLNTSGTGSMILQVRKQEYYCRATDNCYGTGFNPNVKRKYVAPASLRSSRAFKYGYFEIRCKLPKITESDNAKGFGANFWLSGHTHDNGSVDDAQDIYPYLESTLIPSDHYGEIDIFEFVGYGADLTSNAHLTCQHSDPYDPARTITGDLVYNFSFTNFPPLTLDEDGWASMNNTNPQQGGNYIKTVDDGQYHTYGVLWLPNKLEFYMDGEVTTESNFFGLASHILPRSIILDINVGFDQDNNTMKIFDYEIDWVRVWELNMNNCSESYVGCDLSQIQNSVYTFINITGSSCSFQLGPNDEKDFWVTKQFKIDDNVKFKIDSGTEFKIDFTECHTQVILD